MLQSIRLNRTFALYVGAAVAVLMAFYAWVGTQAANALASPTTGVDYVADLVTPVKDELTLAIVAGLALLVVIIALRVGIKMVRSFGR